MTDAQESRFHTQLHPRLDMLEQEVKEQVANVGEVLMIPRGDSPDEWSMIEAIVLQARGMDIGQGRPSWASIRISRAGVTGSFADFGATVENGVRLLRLQLNEQHAPGQLAADATMTQAKVVAPVPPGRDEDQGSGPGLASTLATVPVVTQPPASTTSSLPAGDAATSSIRQLSTPAGSPATGQHRKPQPAPPKQRAGSSTGKADSDTAVFDALQSDLESGK